MSGVCNIQVDQGADMSFGVTWRTSSPASTWGPAFDYGVGDNVLPRQSTGFLYTCTTAGLSDQYEPSWPCELGQTVEDGSITWTTTGPDVVPIDVKVGWHAFLSVGLKGVPPLVTVTDVPSSDGGIYLYDDGTIKVVIYGSVTIGFTAPVYYYDLFVVNNGSATPYTTQLVHGTVTANSNITTPIW